MTPASHKRILICIDWYEPGFKAGGPIRSVANIVNAFKNDYEFYILTSAFDLGETEPYPGIELNQWHDRDGVFIKYMDRRALTMPSISGNIREIEPDLLYLNSLFSRLFTLVPLWVAKRRGVKVVLAPRGMLRKEALDIKSKKKRVFLSFARLLGLYKNVLWHVSTEIEGQEVIDAFGKSTKIMVAQNLPATQVKTVEEVLSRKNASVRRFVYVSRITPNKNLLLAIKCLGHAKSTAILEFHVYGNIENQDYFDECVKLAASYTNFTMTYKGVAAPGTISDILAESNFMLLPTEFENYGHAIVEAWANGCPVIISQNTPWKNLREQQLGWDIDIRQEQNLVDALQSAIDMDFTYYLAMVRCCYNYFGEKISDAAVIEANRKLFEV